MKKRDFIKSLVALPVVVNNLDKLFPVDNYYSYIEKAFNNMIDEIFQNLMEASRNPLV